MLAEHLGVEAGVTAQLLARVGGGNVDPLQRVPELRAVPGNESRSQRGLGGEMVVQAGLGDVQLGGDVGVAEPVEALGLHQALRHVEDALRGVHANPLSDLPTG